MRSTPVFVARTAGLREAVAVQEQRVACFQLKGNWTRRSPRQRQDAVERLAEVPGLGVDSAQQIIAEVGATAATFPSAKNLVSWVGACPGEEESAGVNHSKRSPKGNRQMRSF